MIWYDKARYGMILENTCMQKPRLTDKTSMFSEVVVMDQREIPPCFWRHLFD